VFAGEKNKGEPVLWIFPQQEPGELPSLALAYIGDAVFELYIRMFLLNKGIVKGIELHREASELVKASSQARFLHTLDKLLDEDERAVAKRGRNAKSGHVPRNAEVVDYRLSTGFEALLGYLFLSRQEARISELLGYLFTEIENERA
jgi:ribonuclease-3 family protein